MLLNFYGNFHKNFQLILHSKFNYFSLEIPRLITWQEKPTQLPYFFIPEIDPIPYYKLLDYSSKGLQMTRGLERYKIL